MAHITGTLANTLTEMQQLLHIDNENYYYYYFFQFVQPSYQVPKNRLALVKCCFCSCGIIIYHYTHLTALIPGLPG